MVSATIIKYLFSVLSCMGTGSHSWLCMNMDHYLTTKPNSYFLWFTRDMTSWLTIAVHNEFWGFYKVLSTLMVTGNNESSYSGACVLIMGWVNSNCILCNRAATSITTVSSLSYQRSAWPIWLTQPQSVVCTHSAHKLHNEIHSLHDIFLNKLFGYW